MVRGYVVILLCGAGCLCVCVWGSAPPVRRFLHYAALAFCRRQTKYGHACGACAVLAQELDKGILRLAAALPYRAFVWSVWAGDADESWPSDTAAVGTVCGWPDVVATTLPVPPFLWSTATAGRTSPAAAGPQRVLRRVLSAGRNVQLARPLPELLRQEASLLAAPCGSPAAARERRRGQPVCLPSTASHSVVVGFFLFFFF